MALIGNTWFRNNITPYLTKIKDEIPVARAFPVVTELTVDFFTPNTVTSTSITGENFTPITKLVCDSANITTINIVNSQLITFDIELTGTGINTLIVHTEHGSTIVAVNKELTWTDLRLGSSDTFTTEVYPGSNEVRTVNGVKSDESDIRNNYLSIPSHPWLRSTPKKVSMIFWHGVDRLDSVYIGIFSANKNKTTTYQYKDSEIMTRWNGYGSISSFVGTDSGNNYRIVSSLTNNYFSGYIKVVFTNNGTAGSICTITPLGETLSSLDDVGSNPVDYTITAEFTADEPNLEIAIVSVTDVYLTAFKVESE